TRIRCADRALHRALHAAGPRGTRVRLAVGVRRARRAEPHRPERLGDARHLEAHAHVRAVGVHRARGLRGIRHLLPDDRLLGVGAGVGTELLARLIAEAGDAHLDLVAVDHRERRAAGVALALALAVALVEAEEIRVALAGNRAADRRLVDLELDADHA